MTRTTDRKKPIFSPNRARKAETNYRVQLRKIARHVGEIVNGFTAGEAEAMRRMTFMLGNYAEMLNDWATSTAHKMLLNVNSRDEQTWLELSSEMSRHMRNEIRKAPTGRVMQELLADQVTLIKSIPLDAAKRVHELTIKGLEDSTRAGEISKMIQESGTVAKSRADLIARTEVSRTASVLTEARARHIGSTQYVWRTSGDSDVRESHRKMNGVVVDWDNPPTLDGMTGHAGCTPNCRCYPEPIIADEEEG